MKNVYIGSTQIHSNSQDIGFAIQGDIEGLDMASLRLPSFDRASIDGGFVPNQLYGGRLITFEGIVYGTTTATFRQRRRTLASAFKINRDSSGSLLPLTMKFKTLDDLLLQVECYTRRFQMPDIAPGYNYATFRVDLYAPDISILSQSTMSENIYVFEGGGMEIPMEIPMDMSNGGVGVVTDLTNSGNINTYPTLTFRGPLTNPTFVNETSGQTLSLTYTLLSGEELVVDTQNRTAVFVEYLGATPVNVRQYVAGDFVVLGAGLNVVKLTNSVYNTTGHVQVSWKDSYLTV